MYFFIKPFSKLKFNKDQKITDFIKVEYSKESNEHFKEILKSWNKQKERNMTNKDQGEI